MLQVEGASIILSLDGNEDTSQTTAMYHPLDYSDGSFISSRNHNGTLSTLVTTCGLVDSLSLHQPPFPSTYAYGPNRLDYIYVSQDIHHASLRSGVLPLYSVFSGDHNAVYLDLDAALLFQDDTHPILPPCRRGLQLTDPRKVQAYNSEREKQVEYHKLMDKLDFVG